MSNNEKSIVVIGATGAVGQEVIHCLNELNFPIKNLRLVASEKSAGKKQLTPFGEITMETISERVFAESDIAIFAASSEVSREWKDRVVSNNCLMIDNSSAFRYDETVPLIIPEINPQSAYKNHGVIANPNCTTAIAAVVLWPLHQAFRLKKIFVTTYQASSGAGAEGMAELYEQTKAHTNNADLPPTKVFQHSLAFNLIPHIDQFQENGYTREEMKVVLETRKIFNDPTLQISCTAVRIPILRAHSESIVIEADKVIDVDQARLILANAPGVALIDAPDENLYPMPTTASNRFDVEVGRVRQNLIFGQYGLELFICGDQLLKGAALNAVQIAKLFI